MREFERLLPTIEPPAGGLARLQRRIASRAKSEPVFRVSRWAWAATACATLAVAAILIQPWVARQQRTHALAAALRTAMAPDQPSGGIRVIDGAAIEMPSGQSNVRLYLVQSTPNAAGGK